MKLQSITLVWIKSEAWKQVFEVFPADISQHSESKVPHMQPYWLILNQKKASIKMAPPLPGRLNITTLCFVSYNS